MSSCCRIHECLPLRVEQEWNCDLRRQHLTARIAWLEKRVPSNPFQGCINALHEALVGESPDVEEAIGSVVMTVVVDAVPQLIRRRRR